MNSAHKDQERALKMKMAGLTSLCDDVQSRPSMKLKIIQFLVN